jgi:thiamine biosynthesis lipoprotein
MAAGAVLPDHLRRWDAMGTTCRAWIVSPDPEPIAMAVEEVVADLEARWSRFLPSSDVSRLNHGADGPVRVTPLTLDLVELAVRWWQATGGSFDPTVLPALEALGYDRDRATGHGSIRPGAPAPGCAAIEIDRSAGTVRLPAGVRIDLGGIGKGHAVDLLAARLHEVPGGLVDLGGDLRVWGTPPADGTGWPIAVEDLRDGSTLAVLGLTEGAVATSSVLRRTWVDGSRTAHHLVDPGSGAPVSGDLVTVTVVAGLASAAEVLAKAAIVTGSLDAARRLLEAHHVAAIVVPAEGPPALVGDVEALCWTLPEMVA